MLKGQCQKHSINCKCQKRLMFLQGDIAELEVSLKVIFRPILFANPQIMSYHIHLRTHSGNDS